MNGPEAVLIRRNKWAEGRFDMNEWAEGRFDINEWAEGRFDMNGNLNGPKARMFRTTVTWSEFRIVIYLLNGNMNWA